MARNYPLDDTSDAARQVVRERLAAMSPAERIERIRAITLAANHMALTGLRMRHPSASEGQLLLELARMRLGPELVRRVYGDG